MTKPMTPDEQIDKVLENVRAMGWNSGWNHHADRAVAEAKSDLKQLIQSERLKARDEVLDKLQVDEWQGDNTQLSITRHDHWKTIESLRRAA